MGRSTHKSHWDGNSKVSIYQVSSAQIYCSHFNIDFTSPYTSFALSQVRYSGSKKMLALFLLPMSLASAASCWFLWCLLAYFRDEKQLRQYSSPSFAGLSCAWIMWKNLNHERSFAVYDAHMQYGRILRIAPNHLSFISPEAIKDIYGHGTLANKDKFYDAFLGSHPNLLDTRDKESHARKRKLYAAAMAQKTVEDKEQNIRDDIVQLVYEWDKLSTTRPKSDQNVFPSNELVDIRRWFNLLMLDLVCDLCFDIKQGFVTQGDDLATCERIDGTQYLAHPEAGTNPNLHYISTLGFAPPTWFRFNQKLFSWHQGAKTGQIFSDYVIHLVRKRLAMGKTTSSEDHADFFHSLNYTKGGVPIGMDIGELVQECSLIMNAGSETTTCALQNIMYHLILNQSCMDKLYDEISPAFEDDEIVPSFDRIKLLPYLRACIDETLRHRPSLAIGLPRVTPSEGMYVAHTWVPGDTTVSIPTWGMHHDPDVFEKPFEFIPERWLGKAGADLQKYMLPFSAGARQCVGRNVAYTELSLIVATIVKRYGFALCKPGWEPTVYETMVLKTGPMPVKIWRRDEGMKAKSG